jgi:hypothetical protein
MKRCNGSLLKDTMVEFHTFWDTIQTKRWGETNMSLLSTSEDQKQVQSPRKKDKDTYEVRVVGRRKE